MARSTGCAEENGLLPTRGVRAPGLGPGVAGRGPGAGGAAGEGAAAAGAGAGASAAGAAGAADAAGAAGLGAAGAAGLAAASAAAAGAGFAGPGVAVGAGVAGVALAGAGAAGASAFGAGLPPPKDSRSRRATGASTVEDADLTNSPCSLRRARTSLLVTPSSLANSCTRAFATTSPVYEATAVVGRASGLAMTHGHRDFTVCSCSSLPVLLTGAASRSSNPSKYSSTPDTSGEPLIRSARTNARFRIAACRHSVAGCNHAPRPGWLPAWSMITAPWPFSVDTATTRSNSMVNARFRHPTHVRTGPSGERCDREAVVEVSRWITAQSTHTTAITRTNRIRSPRGSHRRAGRVGVQCSWPRSAQASCATP